jgi:hypothetical protein
MVPQFDEGCHGWESLAVKDEIPMRQRIEIGLDEKKIGTSLGKRMF